MHGCSLAAIDMVAQEFGWTLALVAPGLDAILIEMTCFWVLQSPPLPASSGLLDAMVTIQPQLKERHPAGLLHLATDQE